MEITPTNNRIRDWLRLLVAIAMGPIFLQIPLLVIFPLGRLLVWTIVVPLLILPRVRWKFLIWQMAVLSLAVSFVADDFFHFPQYLHQDITVGLVLWAGGTLFSSPLPIYRFLQPRTPRQRMLYGIAIVIAAVAMCIGMKMMGYSPLATPLNSGP